MKNARLSLRATPSCTTPASSPPASLPHPYYTQRQQSCRRFASRNDLQLSAQSGGSSAAVVIYRRDERRGREREDVGGRARRRRAEARDSHSSLSNSSHTQARGIPRRYAPPDRLRV